MHDGKIIIFFHFFLFRLGTLIVRDADLVCRNNVNSLDKFFWIRNGSCGVLVKGHGFNQVWTVLSFWPKVVHIAPVKGKKYESDWTDLG